MTETLSRYIFLKSKKKDRKLNFIVFLQTKTIMNRIVPNINKIKYMFKII